MLQLVPHVGKECDNDVILMHRMIRADRFPVAIADVTRLEYNWVPGQDSWRPPKHIKDNKILAHTSRRTRHLWVTRVLQAYTCIKKNQHILLQHGHAKRRPGASKKTDKQSWCASLFWKHKVTLVHFFKVTVSKRVTGLIKGYWLHAANREAEQRENKPLCGSALGKSLCWLRIRQRVPSILALSHWQYWGGGGLIWANGNCDLFFWEPLNGSFSSGYLILSFNYPRFILPGESS